MCSYFHSAPTNKEKTGCTCSGGIGESVTLAGLALKKAKPNGCFAAPALSLEPSLFSVSLQILQQAKDTRKQSYLGIDFDRLQLQSEKEIDNSTLLSWIAGFGVTDLHGVGYKMQRKFENLNVTSLRELLMLRLVRVTFLNFLFYIIKHCLINGIGNYTQTFWSQSWHKAVFVGERNRRQTYDIIARAQINQCRAFICC